MVATHITLAGLMTLSIASATPVQGSSEARSFKLPMTRRAGKVTDDQSLTDIYTSTDWTTVVSFGGQNFSLQVDTGSSDIWVLSTEMAPAARSVFPSNHFYDCQKSQTCTVVSGAKFNISYIGNIYGAGLVATDNVSINTASVNMPFGVATDVSPHNMVDTMYDGILGLAFGAGNTQSPTQGPTFMEAMQSQLDEPVFTFNLPETTGGQMIEFGHVDQNLYNGTLQEVAINNGTKSTPMGWTAMASFSVGGKNISLELDHMLFDTGGLQAGVSNTVAQAYWSNVNGAKDVSGQGTDWAFPCSASSLPDLTYNFIGTDGKTVSAVVPGKFMNSTQPNYSDETLCTGALQGKGSATLGPVGYGFFHSFFTVFDQSKPSISFAPYPQQELNGQDLVISSSGAASATTLTATATASNGGVKTKPTGDATETQTASANGTIASSHAPTVTSNTPVAVTAAPTGASDAAPGGSSSTAKSSASGLTIPSFAVAVFAAAVGLMAL